MRFIYFFILALSNLLYVSCSRLRTDGEEFRVSSLSSLKSSKFNYNLMDKSGKFSLVRSSGFNSKNSFFSKYIIYPATELGASQQSNKSKPVERAVLISKLGSLGDFKVLRPHLSEFVVWFEGKKYLSKIKLNEETKKLDVKLTSPEKKWNGSQSFDLPNNKGLLCFFNQLAECIKVTGFLEKAIKEKAGSAQLNLIWAGYPFIHEQYLNIGNQLINSAKLSYDGEVEDDGFRFSLEVSGQNLFIIFNKKLDLEKVFWISQGYTLVKE